MIYVISDRENVPVARALSLPSSLPIEKRLLVTLGKEGTLEGSPLEARSKTGVFGIFHVSVNGNGTIPIIIALFHNLVDRSNDFENASRIPWELVNGILQFGPFQLVILVSVKVVTSTTDNVRSTGTAGVLVGRILVVSHGIQVGTLLRIGALLVLTSHGGHK